MMRPWGCRQRRLRQGGRHVVSHPDVFVVRDLDPRKRRVYKLWVERRPPDVILEVTSRKTKRKDTVTNPPLYARLGVREYFLFDPTQEYLDPPLQGQRLAGNRYEPIAADPQGALESEALGLRLQGEGGQLVLFRRDTGERLLTSEEARRAAEAEVARLREELRRHNR
jgi:Uma2 family endonuclease